MVKPILPGRPARGSKSGRPIMLLLDLLGRRWVLRLIWELREEPKRFRELQVAIGASPTIVNERLAELRATKLVELDDASGYRLTTLGKELLHLFLPLNVWSEKWANRLSA
ncbi:MAG: helix-turn-helix transcriptional regulator [Proteobacteria bacterium]|nr:helix-turn-helix transcriptional regulator [Pseudomonadota bacterium]